MWGKMVRFVLYEQIRVKECHRMLKGVKDMRTIIEALEEIIEDRFMRAIKDNAICKICIADTIYQIETAKETEWITSAYRSNNRAFTIPLQDKNDSNNLFQVLEIIESDTLSGYDGLTIIKINKDAFKPCYQPIFKDDMFILKGSIMSFPCGEPIPFYLAIKFIA